MPGLRREPHILMDENGLPVRAVDLEVEVGIVQSVITSRERDLRLRQGSIRILNSRSNDGGESWYLASTPPSDPEFINFSLELALSYLFQEIPQATNFSQYIDTLVRFSVTFNLLRSFQYCNETTLANTLNFVMMLYQGPGIDKTNYQSEFYFKSLGRLSTLNISFMNAVLVDALRIAPPFLSSSTGGGVRLGSSGSQLKGVRVPGSKMSMTTARSLQKEMKKSLKQRSDS